jgi:hypothetical protein
VQESDGILSSVCTVFLGGAKSGLYGWEQVRDSRKFSSSSTTSCCGRPAFTTSPARWELISMPTSFGNCATAANRLSDLGCRHQRQRPAGSATAGTPAQGARLKRSQDLGARGSRSEQGGARSRPQCLGRSTRQRDRAIQDTAHEPVVRNNKLYVSYIGHPKNWHLNVIDTVIIFNLQQPSPGQSFRP